MIPTTSTSRQYRTLEAIALLSLLISVSVTNLLYGLNVVEHNPVVTWALGHTGWLVIGAAALGITAGAFSLLRWSDSQWDSPWFGRLAVFVAAVSLGNVANDLWVLSHHGVPETMLLGEYVSFVALLGAVAGLLVTRYEVVAVGDRLVTSKRVASAARASLIVIVTLSAVVGMQFAPFVGNLGSHDGVVEGQSGDWSLDKEISVGNRILDLNVGPNGEKVAVALESASEVEVYDIESGDKVITIANASGDVAAVAWSPDGEHLAYGMESTGYVRVYNTGPLWDFEAELTAATNNGFVNDIEFSNDGSYLAYSDNGPAIHIANAGDWSAETSFSPSGNIGAQAEELSWSPNDDTLAIGGHLGDVSLYSTSGWSYDRDIASSASGEVRSVEFTNSGDKIGFSVGVTSSGGAHAFIHSTSDWSNLHELSDGNSDHATWGPDGNYFGFDDGSYTLFDESSDSVETSLSSGGQGSDFSPEGKKLVYSTGSSFRIHDTPITIPGILVKTVDKSGEPIEGASVEVEKEDGSTVEKSTNSKGNAEFTFDSVQYVDISAETAIDTAGESNVKAIAGKGYRKFELTPGDVKVVDEDGNPVEGATVVATGPRNSALDVNQSDAQALRAAAKDLLDDLSEQQLEPDSWNPSIGIDQITETADNVADGKYIAVHEPNDWQFQNRENLEEPTISADTNDVVLSTWDTTQGNNFGTDPIEQRLPGGTTGGDVNVVVEQLGPEGEIVNKETLETTKLSNTLEWWGFDTNDHYGVRTYLPKGHFYRVYPEGSPESSYVIVSGNPDEIVDVWVQDVKDEANNLIDQAEQIEQLLANGDLWQDRAVTGPQGGATLESVPSDVEVVDVRAIKGPDVGDLSQAVEEGIINSTSLENLTLGQLVELSEAGIYEAGYVRGKRERIESFPAEIEAERVQTLQFENIINNSEIIDDIQDVINETRDRIDDIEGQLDELIALRKELQNQTKDVDGFMQHFSEQYPEYADDGEYNFSTPESIDEAEKQIFAIKDAVETYDGIDGGEIDGEIGDIEDTLTKVVKIPDAVNSLDYIKEVTISYGDAEDEQIGDEYLSIEERSGDELDWRGNALVISDYEVASANITGVSVEFKSPNDDINESVGDVSANLTRNIDIPDAISEMAQVGAVLVIYEDKIVEGVARENLTLFPDNSTLRIEDHPVRPDANISRVNIEFSELDKEIDNITRDPISDVLYLNKSFEIPVSPDNINLASSNTAPEDANYVFAVFGPTPEGSRSNTERVPIYSEYIDVTDKDNDDQASLNITWPVPSQFEAESFKSLDLTNFNTTDTIEEPVDPPIDVEENTSRYLNTSVQLENSYSSLDNLSATVFYSSAASENITSDYLSLNSTSNVLTIDSYPVGTKAISYLEVRGTGTQDTSVEIINETRDITETKETLKGRILMDADIDGLDQLTATAYWQNGDVQELGSKYLTLEPTSSGPGTYLVVDGVPTEGRDLNRIDISVTDVNETIDPIEGGQFLNAEVSFDDGLFSIEDLSPDDVTMFVEWQDGETTEIPNQYWEVNGELTGVGTVEVNDYPIPENKVAGNIEVIARAGEEIYRISERVESPEYQGESADLQYVTVSSLEPRVGEIVSVRSQLEDSAESVELVNATVISPRGTEMETTLNDDGSVSFPVDDGVGTYRVDLTYQDTSNATDVKWERSIPIEASPEGTSHPPTIHEMGSDQPFAFVAGDNVLGGNVEVDLVDQTKTMTVTMERGSTPSSVHVHPEETGSGGTYQVNVREGENEQNVASRVSVVLHMPLGDSALVYREGNLPLTSDGTSFGELGKDAGTIRTYTDQNGEVDIRVIQDPGILDRAVFAGRTLIHDFSLPFGFIRFVGFSLVSILLFSRRRVIEVIAIWR